MDALTDAPLALMLGVLALLDGLSVGTLLIPLFFLIAPGRVRSGRVLLYLVTIGVFYLAVGALFLLGLVNLVDVAQDILSSVSGQIVRLMAGAALLATGILMGFGSSKKPAPVASRDLSTDDARSAAAGGGHGTATAAATDSRLSRWRDRVLSPHASAGAVMTVAIGAGLIEIATMLPYLVAMGMLAEAPLTMPVRVAALAGYCAVMVLPAVLLLLLRVVAAPLVERPLARLAGWMEREGRENTAWILGIIGFLIAQGAAKELGLFPGFL
ncbi:GAP family protein [Microbacterium caowuchunii]|uniref:Sap, sulfolipid-1-addressing protein n=1 Tax=Microbacterium caowuchunii TaxID=2614638 RepID=A0A5N0TCX7_9MICO|nr:GAP family protein [Microbacterium caowuchunii]KAA9132882.1 hypothetical protein F6B40_10310 [Microbacterium caowuchunii]